MYNFDYVKPGSVDEAVAVLSDDEAMPISGGQTLIPTLKARLAMPTQLVDLSGAVPKGIRMDRGGAVFVGGATTHATVAASSDAGAVAGLAGLAAHIGDPQVRNKGTIGGSLANNDPAACYPSAALALGAEIVTNNRTIQADDYFQGMFDTALEEGEIITEVVFPSVHGDSGRGDQTRGRLVSGHYEKFVQPASRFALTGVYVARFSNAVRVAVTGASEGGVFRWTDAEEALTANFSADAVPAAPSADDMIGDIHGTPAYRAHLVQVMTKRAVIAC
ncbi:MAG: xanthine dehydrogenase family protein subunit M [Pseudomonadota bacterium]